MCARFEFNQQTCKPGAEVVVRAERGVARHVWAGFARREALDWWMRRGGEVVDVYADRFAERSDSTGKLEWDDVPAGLVIRGVVDRQTGQPLLKVVTRASSEEERSRFDHLRMPVMEPPLFERVDVGVEPSGQPELF